MSRPITRDDVETVVLPFYRLALTRSFRIDTVDIHEVVDGRVARVHHVEDWASALRQVRA